MASSRSNSTTSSNHVDVTGSNRSASLSTSDNSNTLGLFDYAIAVAGGTPPRSSGGLPSATSSANVNGTLDGMFPTSGASQVNPSSSSIPSHHHQQQQDYATYIAPHPPRSSSGLPPSATSTSFTGTTTAPAYQQRPPGSSHGPSGSGSALNTVPGAQLQTNTAPSSTNLWGYSVPSPPGTAQSQSGATGSLNNPVPPGTAGSTSSIPLHNNSLQLTQQAALAAGFTMPSTSAGQQPYHGYNLSNT